MLLYEGESVLEKENTENIEEDQWRDGRGVGAVAPPSNDKLLGALKFVIANVQCYTKYMKSSLSTNSKI